MLCDISPPLSPPGENTFYIKAEIPFSLRINKQTKIPHTSHKQNKHQNCCMHFPCCNLLVWGISVSFFPKARLKRAKKNLFSHLVDVFKFLKSFCASVILVSAVFGMVVMLEMCLKNCIYFFYFSLRSSFGNMLQVVDIPTGVGRGRSHKK